ncbi:acylphosphatase [Dactylosporangium sp. NPDC005572]|uniref:acylphosphatase n=1 Tax=Dactylosporangium sp. NPDC005572 TaxID=3156889 RepID=UPI0033B5C6A2
MIRRRVLVSGRVQGVYFRDTCRRVATAAGVGGWVRNLADGRVEAVFEGADADVARMLDWAGQGPRSAVVTDVAVHEEPPEGLTGFTVR